MSTSKPREWWIRDQVLNFGDIKGAKFIAFETSDVEGKGIIHVIEAAPVLAEIAGMQKDLAYFTSQLRKEEAENEKLKKQVAEFKSALEAIDRANMGG